MRRKLSRREIDRLENLLILLLVCLALFLIHRTGMFQSVTEQGSGTGDESLFAGVQDTALSRGTPVRLMVQNGTGRYGVQYDQTTVNRLYHDGLNDLLPMFPLRLTILPLSRHWPGRSRHSPAASPSGKLSLHRRR